MAITLTGLLCFSTFANADNGYCTSAARYSNYEWIDTISINGEALQSPDNNGYFEHIDDVISINPGDNQITFTPGYSGHNYREKWQAWIDINADDQFTNDESIASFSSTTEKTITFSLPEDVDLGITTLRVVMSYYNHANACGTYTFGETEDITVSIEEEQAEITHPYALSLDYDFTVNRSGYIGDNISWVVEKDGVIVLQRNAAGDLAFKYYSNTNNSNIRVWLQEYIVDGYQQVSNIVEYQPGVTDTIELTLDEGYNVSRSGNTGDNVTWVIEKDGDIVLERNASNELSYTYFNNIAGSQYNIWLKQFIDGEYTIVSNTISYEVGQTNFNLSVDVNFNLSRNGQLLDPVQWVVEQDGIVVLERNAANELDYTYFNNTPGSSYRIWLKMFIDGQYEIVSDVVEYDIPAAYPYNLSLSGYTVTRTGSLGDNLSWVVIKNGATVLQRNAANELSYTYFSNTPGSDISIYLVQFINGYYQPVSNTAEYSVP